MAHTETPRPSYPWERPDLFGAPQTVAVPSRTLYPLAFAPWLPFLICVNATRAPRISLWPLPFQPWTNMRLSRRPMRHITWMILVVWLFALGAGVANACLLNTPNDSTQSSFSAANHGAPVLHAHQKKPADSSTVACLKFCDEPRLAITKSDQPIGDGGASMVGPWPRAPVLTVASASAAHLSVTSHRPAHMALPIAARPHRLTL